MTGPRPLLALLGAVAALAACAGEPTSPSAARAESITAATILARIAALADDSMLGRATPSPQLDGAVLYAARALAAFGLEPAFGAGYLQTWSERGFTSPNAAAVLPGADAQLHAEVVVFVAHLDHIGTATSGQGCAADGADSICNGADDDASGSAAVLELARAYAGLAPRPRRSMLFLLVSGEERGLLGSTWYVANPAVPIARTVAAVALDMISRNAPDSVRLRAVAVTALDTLGLAVAASHPELRLRPVIEYGGGSDHVPFAEAGVPSVALFTGLHADYHRASDAVDRVDADKAARVARLAFYLGLELANRAGS